jgi:hypothetical protein
MSMKRLTAILYATEITEQVSPELALYHFPHSNVVPDATAPGADAVLLAYVADPVGVTPAMVVGVYVPKAGDRQMTVPLVRSVLEHAGLMAGLYAISVVVLIPWA